MIWFKSIGFFVDAQFMREEWSQWQCSDSSAGACPREGHVMLARFANTVGIDSRSVCSAQAKTQTSSEPNNLCHSWVRRSLPTEWHTHTEPTVSQTFWKNKTGVPIKTWISVDGIDRKHSAWHWRPETVWTTVPLHFISRLWQMSCRYVAPSWYPKALYKASHSPSHTLMGSAAAMQSAAKLTESSSGFSVLPQDTWDCQSRELKCPTCADNWAKTTPYFLIHLSQSEPLSRSMILGLRVLSNICVTFSLCQL